MYFLFDQGLYKLSDLSMLSHTLESPHQSTVADILSDPAVLCNLSANFVSGKYVREKTCYYTTVPVCILQTALTAALPLGPSAT